MSEHHQARQAQALSGVGVRGGKDMSPGTFATVEEEAWQQAQAEKLTLLARAKRATATLQRICT